VAHVKETHFSVFQICSVATKLWSPAKLESDAKPGQYDISIFINNGPAQQQHKHDGRRRGEDTCNSQRETDNDNDALLIQYKRNNIGFPFPHPLRS